MKLQNKINIRFLIVTFLVFTVAGTVFYMVLGKVIDQNIDEILESRSSNIQLYLRGHTLSGSVLESPDHSISIKPMLQQKNYKRLTDTLMYDENEKEPIRCRKMIITTFINKKCYEVTIIQSLLESEDLMAVIFYFMVVLFVLILLALFFLNRWLTVSAWKPFFNSLTKLKSFKIGISSNIRFDETGTYEFDQLNHTLNVMIQKIQTDFINLKEFTENASHEIQTPLAIIKSKLELILQDKILTDKQHQQIHVAYESAIRLSKLNEALLLLSKIENRQFVEQAKIDLCELIKSRLEYLEELFALKQIEVMVNMETPVIVLINPVLADILINNLLSNSLKHNIAQGKIIISSHNRVITISNTGTPLTIDTSKLFQRFVKQGVYSESTGLGLAITNEICKNFNISLHYEYQNELHSIILGC